jgi:hypothetical protein
MNSTETVTQQVAELVQEYVVAEADDVIHGVTFDGKRLVLAAGNRLLRLSPESGRVVDQLETFPDRGGIAFDGRLLWQHSEGRIQQLDPRTGFVCRSLSARVSPITGLECIDNDLLLLHSAGHGLARVETLDARPIADVVVQASVRGLAWVARELWSSMPGALCRLDPTSGRILAQFALPASLDVCDLAGDSQGRVWCVDGRSRRLRAIGVPSV